MDDEGRGHQEKHGVKESIDISAPVPEIWAKPSESAFKHKSSSITNFAAIPLPFQGSGTTRRGLVDDVSNDAAVVLVAEIFMTLYGDKAGEGGRAAERQPWGRWTRNFSRPIYRQGGSSVEKEPHKSDRPGRSYRLNRLLVLQMQAWPYYCNGCAES
ncbi:hypothetical protein PISMIDRAFT_679610, partial [Pisolithus microcarpus 441]